MASMTQGVRTGTSRLATETKHALKTTEFWSFVVVVVAILVSAAAIKGGDSGGTDEFIARHAWLYVAIVTADYLISRGLAESGSRTPYWEDSGQNRSRNGTSSDHRARERAASAWGPVWRGARGRPATDTGAAASISRGAGRERR